MVDGYHARMNAPKPINPPHVSWPDIEWVLLDMDGTLLDLAYDNHFWREAVPQAYAQAQSLTLEQARARLEPEFTRIAHTLPWYCTDHWSRVTGLDIRALKRSLRHRIAALDGSADFLRAVRASGRKLWLATNAHRDSWELKLEETGLRAHFDAIICSHDFGHAKEAQGFWQGVMARHPFARNRALFADDSLPVLRAARTFGIAHLVAMAAPDTTQPRREITEFTSVARLGELLPVA